MAPGDPVEAVLFDLDDTICEYRRPGGELLDVAFESVGVDPFFDVGEYHDRYPEFADVADTVRELRAECFAAIAADRGRDPDLGRAVAARYAAERDHRNVRFLPGAREAIDALADRYPLGLVTNGAPGMQGEKLAGLGIEGAFEVVVHGGHDAPAKPAPDPFEAALSALDAAPERAVHVGNSLRSDVTGAHAAGIRSAWLRGDDVLEGGDPDPTYVLDTPGDLADPPWLSR